MDTPIFGTYGVSRSSNASDNQLTNLFPEVIDTKQGKAVGALYGCPGLDLLTTVGAGPIKAMHVMAGVLYVVSGTTLYSVTPGYVVTNLGSVLPPTVGGLPGNGVFAYSVALGLSTVTMPFTMLAGDATYYLTDNGTQLGIFVGITPCQQDGFILVNQPGSYLIWQSNLLDLTTWNALNFASASGDPDNIVRMFQLRRLIFVLKQKNTEVWQNVGTTGFAFQRLDGTFIETGCIAPHSVAKTGQEIKWISQTSQGERVVVSLQGISSPTRISDHAVEFAMSQYSTVADALGYAYQQEGHVFYVLTFPTANATWVYDATSSALAGVPMWHQRAQFAAGVFTRHIGQAYAFFNDRPVIGSYVNGALYAYDLNTLTFADLGSKWIRSWRALQKPNPQPMRFASLTIDMQTGINIASGANPQVVLRWSDDGGHTWANGRIGSVGQIGQTGFRVKFNRLGATRRNSGLDRIFELSSTDTFPVTIINAELEV